MKKTKPVLTKEVVPMRPCLTVYLTDVHWPKVSMLVLADTGREYTAEAVYDIAHSQLEVVLMNAFRDNLKVTIEVAKRQAK